ncbi:MAG: AMP-binding protein, partial [Reichenbachiella sp.]
MPHSIDKLLWSPSEDFKVNSNMQHYLNWLEEDLSISLKSYDDLWQWSNDHNDEFWKSLLRYFDISYSGTYQKVKSQNEMPGVKWFEGTSLNYAEHVFKHENCVNPALIFKSESRLTQYVSWKELKQQVVSLQYYLKSCGVGKGDRVIGYLPNIPQATVAFLAANSLGAVWSSASPDFGLDALIDRFAQIEPKVLIAVDGYQYGGKSFDRTDVVTQLQKQIASIQQTVLIPYLKDESNVGGQFERWEEVINSKVTHEMTFERVPFNDPIWVLYSSGTTGKPKAITHSV